MEGYPVPPKRNVASTNYAFTGFVSAFEDAGFTECLRRSKTRPIMRYYGATPSKQLHPDPSCIDREVTEDSGVADLSAQERSDGRVSRNGVSVVITHTGGCHCGRVRFEVIAPARFEVTNCDCSICSRSGYLHLIVPKDDASHLLSGADVPHHVRVQYERPRSTCSARSAESSRSMFRARIPTATASTRAAWTTERWSR